MSLHIGLYGSHDTELIEAVQSVCTLLGGDLVLLDAVPADSEPKSVQVLIWYMGQHPIKLSIEQQQWLNIYILRQRRITKALVNDLVFDGTVIFEQYMIFPFDPEEFAMRIINGSLRRGYQLDYRLDYRLRTFADACEVRAKRSS
ncbi:MAG TPA: hypothetical protein DEF47_16050 [Herpetosiphon sp.]|nr:hypothetical protein [Herpetosiphon sp.]HBW51407.1 hypothetical protein [Herpetosiphon sp.]